MQKKGIWDEENPEMFAQKTRNQNLYMANKYGRSWFFAICTFLVLCGKCCHRLGDSKLSFILQPKQLLIFIQVIYPKILNPWIK